MCQALLLHSDKTMVIISENLAGYRKLVQKSEFGSKHDRGSWVWKMGEKCCWAVMLFCKEKGIMKTQNEKRQKFCCCERKGAGMG